MSLNVEPGNQIVPSRRTLRPLRRPGRTATRQGGRHDRSEWPQYDLREELKRDVQSVHKSIDRIREKGDSYRARYRKDNDIRWLQRAEEGGMAAALEAYRQAAARAAIVTRLYNVAVKRKRPETSEHHVLAFIRKNVVGGELDEKSTAAAQRFARALHHYVHEETTRRTDAAVRNAWIALGRRCRKTAKDKAFLFDIPAPKKGGG